MILGDSKCDPFGGGAFECSFYQLDEALRTGVEPKGVTTLLTMEEMLAAWLGADHACKDQPDRKRCDAP